LSHRGDGVDEACRITDWQRARFANAYECRRPVGCGCLGMRRVLWRQSIRRLDMKDDAVEGGHFAGSGE